MVEWWTYRLDDFLMFSPRTYYRLGELANAEAWPLQGVAAGLGLVVAGLHLRHAKRAPLAGRLFAAAACAAVAACYHLRHYSTVHWAAAGFAALFALQALLLLAGAPWADALPRGTGDRRRAAGLALLGFALLVQPWTGLPQGRPWTQAEFAGLHPDPTMLATLGLLLLQRPTTPRWRGRLAWLLPIGWCLGSAATLSSLGSAEAWLMAGAVLFTLAAARDS